MDAGECETQPHMKCTDEKLSLRGYTNEKPI